MPTQSRRFFPPIAVVGMSCRLPGAAGLQEYWKLLQSGKSSYAELPESRLNRELYFSTDRFALGKSYTTRGGLIPNLPIDTKKLGIDDVADLVDICHLTCCDVAGEALRHAKMDPFNLRDRNVGVYIGGTGGSEWAGDLVFCYMIEEAAAYLRDLPIFKDGPLTVNAKKIVQGAVEDVTAKVRSQYKGKFKKGMNLAAHMSAGIISRAFGLNGPYMAIDAACASSLYGGMLAINALQQGRIDMALVGSASYCKSDSLVLFSAAQSVSESGESRPFDENADGLITSEGYVTLVLKTLDKALADGDPIHGVIRSLGASTDGKGKSLWAPRKEGQIVAIHRAYQDDILPSQVQYLEAHATSTQVGDATELSALMEAFEDKLAPGQKIPLGASKGNVGHTLETAGVAGLTKVLLAMQNTVIPPAANIGKLNPKIDWEHAPFYVPTQAEEWEPRAGDQPRRGAVNAFGIGGLNVHVVVDEFVKEKPTSVYFSSSPEELETERAARVNEPIAVIGMGAIYPGAYTLEQFWDLIKTGRNEISEAPNHRLSKELSLQEHPTEPWHTCTVNGGYIRDWEYDWRRNKIPPKQIANANPLQFMLLDAADQALASAGYDKRKFDRTRVGVIVGTIFGGDFAAQLQMGLRLPEWNKLMRPILAKHGVPADQIETVLVQYRDLLLKRMPALLDETGSFTSSTLASRITKTFDLMGGALALDAGVGSALASINGGMDALRSGSVDMMICCGGQRNMDLMAYSGATNSELLTTQTPQAAFGKDIAGVVPGEGVGVVLLKRLSDAKRDNDPIFAVLRGVGVCSNQKAPAEATPIAIQRALANAQAKPEEVVVLETFGGWDVAEAAEIVGTASAYDSPLGEPMRVGSLVSQIGHCGAASGMASIIKGALELKHQHLPKSNAAEPAPYLADEQHLMTLQSTAAQWNVSQLPTKQLVAVSSGAMSGQMYHAILEHPDTVGKPAVAPAQRPPAKVKPQPYTTLSTRKQSSKTRVAFLFAGQGSQYAGMFKTLVEQSAAARDAMEEADAILARYGYESFAEIAWSEPTELGTDLWKTQLGMLLADYIAYRAAVGAGIEPDVVAGHSFGEYVALVAAGAWDLETAIRCARIRFESLRDGVQVAGAMAAFAATAEVMEKLIAQVGGQLYIANINAPEQTVVSGEALAVQRLREFARGQRVQGVVIPVPCPFHSPLLSHAAELFEAKCNGLSLRSARLPVLSTASARYMLDVEDIRWSLTHQLTLPVRFVDMVRKLHADQPTVFVEIGPQIVLTKLCQKILGPEARIVSVDEPRQPGLAAVEKGAAAVRTWLEQPAAHVTTVEVSKRIEPGKIFEFDATERRRNLNRKIDPKTNGAEPKPAKVSRNGEHAANGNSNGNGSHGPAHVGSNGANGTSGANKASGTKRPEVSPEKISVAATSTVAATAAVATATRNAASEIRDFLVQFVIEQTGYPAELVALDADLEADLGIDSIKKAQMFGEIGYRFQVPPPTGNVTLDDFPTLQHVCDYLNQHSPLASAADLTSADLAEDESSSDGGYAEHEDEDLAVSAGNEEQQQAPATATGVLGDIQGFLVDFVVEQTGYPEELVDLDADLEADLGIDSIKKAQMFGEIGWHFKVAPPSGNVTLDDFPTLRHVLGFLVESLGQGKAHVPATFAQTNPVAGSSLAEELEAPQLETLESLVESNTAVGQAEEIQSFLTNFVVEQTGYPEDLVELDADLEADLGIDSIKKAQMFGEIGWHFKVAPPSGDVTLDDFPTLRHVLNFLVTAVDGGNAAPAQKSPPVQVPQAQATASAGAPAAEAVTVAPVAKPVPKRALPTAPYQTTDSTRRIMQRFEMRLQPMPLAVVTEQWAKRAVILGANAEARTLQQRLASRGVDVIVLDPAEGESRLLKRLEIAWNDGPLNHCFVLTARDGMPMTWQDSNLWQLRRTNGVLLPFWILQKWYELSTSAPQGTPFSLTMVTSLGGSLGFENQVTSPEGGALTGLGKAIGLESEGKIKTRIVDFSPDYQAADLVERLCQETAATHAEQEIAYSRDAGRRVLRGKRIAANKYGVRMVPAGSTWIVTGGARGVTGFIARELGKRLGLKLHLLGSSPAPKVEPEWRNLSPEGLKQLKARIATEARAAGQSPVDAWSRIEKSLELDKSLRVLAEAGVDATYHVCDVSNRAAVSRLVKKLRAEGPICGVIHGAGVEAACKFPKKKRDVVERAIGAKADGAANLLAAIPADELQYFVGLSSTSGRFGGLGQADYALANDFLAKIVASYQRSNPCCRAFAIDWTAWDEVGMAARPESKFALEAMGVKYMPALEGVDHLLDELQAEADSCEALIVDHPGLITGKHVTMQDVDSPLQLSKPTTFTKPAPAPQAKAPQGEALTDDYARGLQYGTQHRHAIQQFVAAVADSLPGATVEPLPGSPIVYVREVTSAEELAGIAAGSGVSAVTLQAHNRGIAAAVTPVGGVPSAVPSASSLPALVLSTNISDLPMLESILAGTKPSSAIATVELRPETDVFLQQHQLHRRPFMPAVVSAESIIETASCLAGNKKFVGLKNFELKNGWTFVTDAAQSFEAQASLANYVDGELQFDAEFASPTDARGPLVTGQVLFADDYPAVPKQPVGDPTFGWTPFYYPDGAVMYHGPVFRTFRELAFQHDGGRVRLVVPPPLQLTGPRPGKTWHLPSALLDGCLVACGCYSYFMLERRLEIPHRIDHLRLHSMPREGELCRMRFFLKKTESRSSTFDFHVVGPDGRMIFTVEGYHGILIDGGDA